LTNKKVESKSQTVTLAGGCFWCIESAFNSVKGIKSAISGYMGGHTTSPTYEDICTGQSGHAEVVQLVFDESIISYQSILEIFFTLHNPTQLNRQGNDIGSQYRSAIFTHNEEQHHLAKNIIKEIMSSRMFDEPVVTEVNHAEVFYSGEDEHQNYFNNNPESQYCQAIVSPKLAKFRQTFVKMLKD